MRDIFSLIHELKRPPLLVRAARFGLDDYQRAQHLRRALQSDDLPGPGAAVMRLLDIERDLNDARLSRSGAYSVARHVDVLIAVMAEANLMKMARQQDQYQD